MFFNNKKPKPVDRAAVLRRAHGVKGSQDLAVFAEMYGVDFERMDSVEFWHWALAIEYFGPAEFAEVIIIWG